jgi:primosomal protein N' (replication factor Y)
MKIVTVIPLGKSAYKEDLTYFTARDVEVGSIVLVPIRNKNTLALVLSAQDAAEEKTNLKDLNFNLKKIKEVKDNSVFLREFFEATLLTSNYFAINKNIGVASLIPNIFLEEYDKISKFKIEANVAKKIGLEEKNIRAEKLLLQVPFKDRVSIYKTLIRASFAEKKSVFIVLPTERDVEQFKDILSKGIEKFTFAFHSGLSTKKTLADLEQAMTLSHPVLILGTAPFLAIKREDVGAIILEHESSSNYRMVARPYFDLRVFVEIFAQKVNTKLILGDTLLRFETISRYDTEELAPMNPLSFRIDFDGKVKIVGKDITEKEEVRNEFKILEDETLEEIATSLKNKKRVFVFALRKGLATMTVCRDCGNTLMCEKCSAPLVLYFSRDGKKRIFACNRCHREEKAETACNVCGGWNLMPLGIGTDTVMEAFKEAFPKNKNIFKLDKESAKTAKGALAIIKDFEENSGSVLVGTEMAINYAKEKIHTSVIASMDSFWSIPNFKISEKILQIVLSIINKTEKYLIIQTKNKSDPSILAIKSVNLLSFVREELSDRKKLGYPPFKRFIKVIHLGDKTKTLETKEALKRIFKDYEPEIFSGFHSKFKDKYVTNMLIKLDTKEWSIPELIPQSNINEGLYKKLLSLPPNFNVFVDPEDLL